MIKNTIQFLIFLFLTTSTFGQKKKIPIIQNISNYIVTESDTIKIQRLNGEEYHKLDNFDPITHKLLDAVLNIQGYLDSRSLGEIPSNPNEIEIRFNNLINYAKIYKVYFDLENYKKELLYIESHPVKTEQEKTTERLAEYNRKENERMQKETDFENENRTHNNRIQRRNDSISIAENRRKTANDSIENIKQKLEIKNRIALNAKQKKYEIQRKAKTKIETAEKINQKKEAIINKYGLENGTAILNHKVKIGWSKSMCIASWGKPYDINRTTNAYGTQEQYVYSLKKYLYFENGVLTTIQN